MVKDEFFKIELVDQVAYFNGKLQQGQSISTTCKEIGISRNITSITDKFKTHGYSLIDGKYVLQQIDGQKNISNLEDKPQEIIKHEVNINTPPIQEEKPMKVIKDIKSKSIKIIKDECIPAKSGRVKTNITLPIDMKIELQVYCIKEKIALSALIEQLANKFLKNLK